ncbi:BirA family biotin operon repressor/biotin-[acetyl-CoA-carboxylase] ligase [Anseongella ginsenosidimutans]|uniref:BirA family biotin operon repressor/biotin-[acetyl-CoA-carboxylase] ligase n=1 Tax=Anseongella ginsenosidimutans TaxID=496056 RepID=A0A4R3KXF6_9SPHI|nr:BirA family biotin operon repressor/biotin-[acetyl-CoA-carboxylase] ligase [Anseongella ginsenosidimutans]
MQISTNNALFIGKNLLTLTKVDSTNNYAKLLLANSGPLPDGTVILAEGQEQGRGQAGNSWLSEPGKNLTFSIVLGCSFLLPADQFYLSMAVSLGILDTLKPVLGNDCHIKWPNDIYAGKKKLGGILIENLLAGAALKTSVIGIGLNVNQERFPGLPRATSLMRETNTALPLEPLLGLLCQSIEARFLQLKGGGRKDLKESYLRHLLGYGKKQLFRSGPGREQQVAGSQPAAPQSAVERPLPGPGESKPGTSEMEPFEGVITGITHEGKLLVETETGLLTFEKKEIVFL